MDKDGRLRVSLDEKLKRPQGLCVSVHCGCEENAIRIHAILNAYLCKEHLQSAHRCDEDWQDCHDLPVNFAEFRYRVIP